MQGPISHLQDAPDPVPSPTDRPAETNDNLLGGTTMAGLGAPELIIILVVVLLLFGTSRLPKLARSIGEASREFKSGALDRGRDDEPAPANGPTR